MKLATVRHAAGTSLAVASDDGYADPTPVLGAPLADVGALCDLLDSDPGVLARLAAAALPVAWTGDEVTVLAPVRRPSKIVCIGLNYLDHCRETNTPVPQSPVVFAKFPSCLIGPGDLIDLHSGSTQEADWEAELAVVIGERCGPGTPPGPGAVLGYTIANDVSARDLQRDDGQWTRAKSLDTFCPLGPVVVTADEIGDPQELAIGLTVNGEPQQESSTSEMIFPVAELISRLAAEMTLLPGDLLLTGTPHGTGGFQDPPRFLRPGDVVEAWIERIGSLTNSAGGLARHPGHANGNGAMLPASLPAPPRT
jgi:2-keto-4-pentenoate hydratase/2-oxohepta-3-ene-1,7-dioic acid hydratase in catechol pathway